MASQKVYSHTKGLGYTSCLMDVPWDEAMRPTPYKATTLGDDITALTVAQGDLITAYLFSKDSMTVVYYSQPGPVYVDWVAYSNLCAEINQIADRKITYKNSRAHLLTYGAKDAPTVEQDRGTTRLKFIPDSDLIGFTFAGPNSTATIKQINSNVVCIEIKEEGITRKVALNLSAEPFQSGADSKAIPDLPPYGAAMLGD